MRIAVILLVVIASLLLAPRALAISEVNGLMLLHQCQASVRVSNEDGRVTTDQVAESNHCLGYLQGVIDANGFWDAIDLRNHQVSRAHYCISKSVTFEQIIRVLVKWLEANPGELDEEGYLVVQKALINSFRCKA
jgi:hypothetical protein